MPNRPKNIEYVDVYFQKRKSRQYVGRLSREDKAFVFVYDDKYLYKDRSISLGPDLPLTAKRFTSATLFPSFEDRIPSKENPAYPEYCEMVGIDPSENDLLVLVATLGHKGPSSFIFVPGTDVSFVAKDFINFRKELNLTVREFADLFDLSPATVHKIEKNKTSGKDMLKRIEIYSLFPEVALYEIEKNGFKINDQKKELVKKYFESKKNIMQNSYNGDGEPF